VIPSDSSAKYVGDSLLPKVTIVVPIHNRPHLLGRLLDSVQLLTYPPNRLQLILAGGADDPGRQVVRAFARIVEFPVDYRPVPEHALRSASFKRNECARCAQGDILAFTDDDCMAHHDWITAAVPLFRAAEVGGVEGAVEIPAPDRLTLTYRRSLRLSLPGGYQTCNMFYRKSVFEECGGFDLTFPYYLEDTDLAYTVLERGYKIPFAADAAVSHPVPSGHPLKVFTIARTVEQMPYLFRKHAQSRLKLRASARPLNRSHCLYLALYGGAIILAAAHPLGGAIGLGLGLSILMSLQLIHDFWGLHVTASEFILTGLSLPVIPVVRLFYWLKGNTRIALRALDRDGEKRTISSTKVKEAVSCRGGSSQ